MEFEPCVHAVKNEPCEMTCRIPDFTQLIEFQCNGSSRGLCSVFFCSPNMIRNGSNAVHFQIPSMSYTADNCEWSCTPLQYIVRTVEKTRLRPGNACQNASQRSLLFNTGKFVKKQVSFFKSLLKSSFLLFYSPRQNFRRELLEKHFVLKCHC